MFPPKRFLKTLKDYEKNRSNLVGCMAEKYLVEEVTKFSSEYFKQAADVGVKHKRNEDVIDGDNVLEGRGFGGKSRPMTPTKLEIAHRYVLMNTILLEPWRDMHKVELKLLDPRLTRNEHQLEKKLLDSFVFLSQAKQVFYSRESKRSDWYVVLKAPPRGFYESENLDEVEYMPCAPFDVSQLGHILDDKDCLTRSHSLIDEDNEDSED